MADASSKYGANDDMSMSGGGQLIEGAKMSETMLYPVGLNLLEKGTRELVSKLTDERTKASWVLFKFKNFLKSSKKF